MLKPPRRMKYLLLLTWLIVGSIVSQTRAYAAQAGIASWYGEKHRGKLMANGKPFNPDKLTAASWFYPLGTRVRVRLDGAPIKKSVVVTITDRGPHRRLVAEGRVIDLGLAAFKRLAHEDIGLVRVRVEPIRIQRAAKTQQFARTQVSAQPHAEEPAGSDRTTRS